MSKSRAFGLLVTAPSSSSGKTMVTMILAELLRRRGLRTAVFKTGPDYIDPMYHRAISGERVYNLDSYLSDADTVRAIYEHSCEGHDLARVEGAMGYYDGLGGVSEQASAYEIGRLLDIPAVLVVPERGIALTEAAIVKGLAALRQRSVESEETEEAEGTDPRGKNSGICAVILNQCSESGYEKAAPVIERETGIEVVGYVPKTPLAQLPSRHLGLVQAGEITDLRARICLAADEAEGTIDISRLLCHAVMKDQPECGRKQSQPATPCKISHHPVIAVARDEAFSFLYQENLDLLRKLGAEIIFFSPIHDKQVPSEADGLYLPGGYPQLHATSISVNDSMLASIHAAYEEGLPLIAECGGYLLLCESIETDGQKASMAGIFPGHVRRTAGLVRFGYAEMTAEEDSLLFRKGETVRVHSFHHFDTEEETRGAAFSLKKAGRAASWQEGYAGSSFYAAFPHLYLPGCARAAERFVQASDEHAAAR